MSRDDKFKNAIEAMICKSMNIILINPSDISEWDMNKFPCDCYFILIEKIERGTSLLIKEDKLKLLFYDFIKYNPSQVLRGRKSIYEFYRGVGE